ncbi:hypothetical protein BCR34DRAFT_556208 [Clohesyomyces aquaticus]|uniref:Uncharacterized protein n=1 Tax=Clohesyomyces aquaticus TaxID=1231657 RepID=A0A1Y2A4E7_9PLEO|nr:hypothetical protein BCR34DRAFT_556208 [Clohesyomyces aquaticus]
MMQGRESRQLKMQAIKEDLNNIAVNMKAKKEDIRAQKEEAPKLLEQEWDMREEQAKKQFKTRKLDLKRKLSAEEKRHRDDVNTLEGIEGKMTVREYKTVIEQLAEKKRKMFHMALSSHDENDN